MLKTIRLFKLSLQIFRTDNNQIIKGCGNRINKTIKNLYESKKLKNIKFEILMNTNFKAIKKLIFLIHITNVMFK